MVVIISVVQMIVLWVITFALTIWRRVLPPSPGLQGDLTSVQVDAEVTGKMIMC